ncbi:MAG: calcium-binding protein [Piscinibacter sp.]
MALILGTNGSDLLNTGTAGDDTYFAGLGADSIVATRGNDLIQAGLTSSAAYWRSGFTAFDFDNVAYDSLAAQNGYAAGDVRIVVDLASGRVTKTGPAGLALGVDTLVGADGVIGTDGNDTFSGRQTWDFDQFRGNAGNDTINGRGGYDGALYENATAAISVDLAAGTVSGNASVGTDTLREIEFVYGTGFADTYVATGFGGGSTNRSSFGEDFNVFAPGAGDDTVVGNGGTVLNYGSSTVALSVNLGLQGGASGAARVIVNAGAYAPGTGPGNDLVSGVEGIRAGSGNDTLVGGSRVNSLTSSVTGSLSTLSTDEGFEMFRGGGGNDSINGGTGVDRAEYNLSGQSIGVNVNLASGLVTGDLLLTGSDTLRGIESITGTYVDDVYDARGFTLTNAAAASANAGDAVIYRPLGETTASLAFNEYRPTAGDDVVLGNGATRVSFQQILIETLSGPSPSIVASFSSAAAGGADYGLTDGGYGHVTFSGTFSLRGGAGNDLITGTTGYQNLQGYYGNDTLSGGTGADLLFGFNGGDSTAQVNTVNRSSGFTDNDSLLGGAGNDLLRGEFGNDVLDGGTGADTMEGGTGSDVYRVDVSTDVTSESVAGAAGGTDTVISLVSRGLGNSIERLTLSGSAAINGSGNSLANVIVGNGAANIINGLAGNDTLTGGLGADDFRFSTALSASGNVDRITDFSVVSDRISLDDAIFGAAGPLGVLNAAAFHSGAAAADASDRIVYNSAKGQLYYDADGNGTGAAILFATVGTGLALTAADFVIV